jgi:hypothetical protein
MADVRETWGMACPQCGRDDRLGVKVKVWAMLSEDGTETHGDHEWNKDSQCMCTDCGWEGPVIHAQVKES